MRTYTDPHPHIWGSTRKLWYNTFLQPDRELLENTGAVVQNNQTRLTLWWDESICIFNSSMGGFDTKLTTFIMNVVI
jgi:hypothetical protein